MKQKIIIFITAALIAALVFSFSACRKRPEPLGPKGKVELSYYGLYDDEDIISPLISAYEKSRKKVRIKYRKFTDPEEYEDMLLNEFAEGKGPDIFQVSNFGLPRFYKKIFPLESPELTPEILEQNFLGVISNDFAKEDVLDGKKKIYGIPLYIDTPVIYYNRKLLEKKLPERGRPAATWKGLMQDAPFFREEDSEKNLVKGGIALGRSDNIINSVDILLNLMLQNGVSFYDSSLKNANFANNDAESALNFFVSFADFTKKQYSWSEKLTSPESKLKEIEAFLSGKSAMIIGYSDIYSMLPVYLRNLKAQGFDVISAGDIGIAPLPQNTEKDEEKRVLARYFANTVSRTSKNPETSWDFIDFITHADQARVYAKNSKRPSSRREILQEQKSDPVLGMFVKQTGFAESIPMWHELKYRELFKDAIQNSLAKASSSSQALSEAQKIINELIPDEGLYPKYAGAKSKKKAKK